MKKYSLVLLVLTLLMACNNSEETPVKKLYVSKVFENGKLSVSNEFDNAHRLIKKYLYLGDTLFATGENSYDNKNRMIQATWSSPYSDYVLYKYNDEHNVLLERSEYLQSDNRLKRFKQYEYSATWQCESFTFFNSDSVPGQKVTCQYFDNGNVSKYIEFFYVTANGGSFIPTGERAFTYDNMHYTRLNHNYTPLNILQINNPLTQVYTNYATGESETLVYTYLYNSDNFPYRETEFNVELNKTTVREFEYITD